MLDLISEGIFSVVENCLLGLFAIVEMINSGESEKIYALSIVALMAVGVSVLISLLIGYCKENKKPKRKSRNKKSKKTSGSTRKASSSVKKSNNNVKVNYTKPRNTKNNSTRINVKKEIKTPGIKNVKRNRVSSKSK